MIRGNFAANNVAFSPQTANGGADAGNLD